MIEPKLELLERAVLHAQCLQSKCVDLLRQVLQQDPTMAIAAVHHGVTILSIRSVPPIGTRPTAATALIATHARRGATSARFAPEILAHRSQVA